MRELLPAEQVTQLIPLVPARCPCGCEDLETFDEPPLRFQTIDLPPIKPKVPEYVQHMRSCKQCGSTVYQPLSEDIKRNVFGAGVLSVVSILTGMLNTSKRKACEVINEVFGVPMSLGGLNTDRWGAYRFYKQVRQICWAHLKRDFKAISESKGGLGRIGKDLHTLAQKILKLHRRVRDGTLQWKTFESWMISHKNDVERLLEKGATYEGALSGKRPGILEHRTDLWTFVDDVNVEPTNNAAEQIIRQAVLWRETNFGTQTKQTRLAGCRANVDSMCHLSSAGQKYHRVCAQGFSLSLE